MAQELWQIAKPFGRPAKFRTPDALWQAFLDYAQWTANNPMIVQDTKAQRRAGLRDEKSQYQQTIARPYSLVAFRLHAGIKRDWDTFKKDYARKSKDFRGVLQAIEESIRQQQVDNAMVGNYKENIVSRINNISDTIRQEVKADIKQQKQLSVQEAREFINQIEKEI